MLSLKVVVPAKLPELIARFDDFDNWAGKHLASAMGKAVADIKEDASKNAPVFHGRLRDSMRSTVTREANEITGRVYSSINSEVYPIVMEKGRRFGRKMPPSGSLIQWIMVKLSLDYKAAKRAEYPIRRKIGKRGIMGKYFLRKAYTANKERIRQHFRTAMRNIVEELTRGRS